MSVPISTLTSTSTSVPTNVPVGRCGVMFGGVECSTSECCSASGWCGSTDAHCGVGCQSNCGLVDFPERCKIPGMVVLTYDDGPVMNSLIVMDKLEARGVKGVFFVNGKNMNEEIISDMLSRGFEIGDHSWSHIILPEIQDDVELRTEIVSTSDLIEDLVGVRPFYFRPPYLAYNNRVDMMVKEVGMRAVSANLDTRDYANLDNMNAVIDMVRMRISGKVDTESYIILQHDRLDWSVEAIDGMLDIILEEGYRIVTLSECLE